MTFARNLLLAMAALLSGCSMVPSAGHDLASAGNLPPVSLLRHQVAFDHGCPGDRTRVIRRDDYTNTVDLDVCGKVRRYHESETDGEWRDITNMYPAESLPAPLPVRQ